MERSINDSTDSKDVNDSPGKTFSHENKLLEDITVIEARHSHPDCKPPEAMASDLFGMLFNLNPHWTVLSNFDDGTIIAANEAFYTTTGYAPHEVIGRSAVSLGLWPDPKDRDHYKCLLVENRRLSSVSLKMKLKDGQMRDFLGTAVLIESRKKRYMLSVVEPLPPKAIEKETPRQAADLAEKLREMNTALRVVNDAWCREKSAIQSRIKYHINVNVLPFIEKIKAAKKRRELHVYLQIVEDNLRDLNPAFSEPGGCTGDDFTPSESQIIQLVKHGKSSKEIAELLNLSTKAISFHRSNIRKKLNLVNKKVSLAAFLRGQDVVS